MSEAHATTQDLRSLRSAIRPRAKAMLTEAVDAVPVPAAAPAASTEAPADAPVEKTGSAGVSVTEIILVLSLIAAIMGVAIATFGSAKKSIGKIAVEASLAPLVMGMAPRMELPPGIRVIGSDGIVASVRIDNPDRDLCETAARAVREAGSSAVLNTIVAATDRAMFPVVSCEAASAAFAAGGAIFLTRPASTGRGIPPGSLRLDGTKPSDNGFLIRDGAAATERLSKGASEYISRGSAELQSPAGARLPAR